MVKDSVVEENKIEEKEEQTTKQENTTTIISETQNTIENEANTNQEATSDKTSSSDKLHRFFHIILIIGITFLAIILIAFIFFTIYNSKNNKILSNVFINNCEVSGLTSEEAYKKINSIVSSTIPDEIILKHDDFQTSISTNTLDISYDISSCINKAYSLGKTGNLLENDFAVIKSLFSSHNITLDFTFNEENLKQQLDELSGKLPDTIVQGNYYIEDTNLIITKGHKGCVVDVNATLNLVKEHLKTFTLKNSIIEIATLEKEPAKLDIDKIHKELYSEPQNATFSQSPYTITPSKNGVDFAISVEEARNLFNKDSEECSIPLKVLFPAITTNMLGNEAFPDQLSTYSTKYSVSATARTTNLVLAASKINGTVIMPGETFSYNKVVGERTIAAGYKEAPIYVSGQVVDGLGGGICQITTTLYNAVLFANLEIVERTNHQFVPSYAPASRDATVVYGSLDFKFKNNRNYPIKLVCSVSGGTANFKIFGLKQDDDCQVEITNRVTGSTANAIYSEAYRTLKQNGQVIKTELLSKDTYKKH